MQPENEENEEFIHHSNEGECDASAPTYTEQDRDGSIYSYQKGRHSFHDSGVQRSFVFMEAS